jgi:hypothetical protein
MKSFSPILLLFVAGCIGDRAVAPTFTTPLPGTELSVNFFGPDTKGQYDYIVRSNDIWIHRPLGSLKPDQIAPGTLHDLGGGIFRIEWGAAAYAVIDTKKELIVEDSNNANPRNQPFSTR